MRCAAEGGLKVQARSGGHSYAAFSSGGRDGGMVVDLRFFNGATVDGEFLDFFCAGVCAMLDELRRAFSTSGE